MARRAGSAFAIACALMLGACQPQGGLGPQPAWTVPTYDPDQAAEGIGHPPAATFEQVVLSCGTTLIGVVESVSSEKTDWEEVVTSRELRVRVLRVVADEARSLEPGDVFVVLHAEMSTDTLTSQASVGREFLISVGSPRSVTTETTPRRTIEEAYSICHTGTYERMTVAGRELGVTTSPLVTGHRRPDRFYGSRSAVLARLEDGSRPPPAEMYARPWSELLDRARNARSAALESHLGYVEVYGPRD